MNGHVLPDRTELVNAYCERYFTSRAEAEEIITLALSVAKNNEDLGHLLFAWLFDVPLDDTILNGVSLLGTAQALHPSFWNLPAACVLAMKEGEEKTAGITSCLGLFCEIGQSLLSSGTLPERIVKTDTEVYRLLGNGREERFVVAEAWKTVLRFPDILTALRKTDAVGTEYRRFEGGYFRWEV